MKTPAVLVLDAMGVIYEVGDDVADLLVPFIREQGGRGDPQLVEAVYHEASLGRVTAQGFWQRVGVATDLEDEYLARHKLSDGVVQLLEAGAARFERVVCLSNDLAVWSRKLRRMFQLEPYLAGWYISGDLGIRKPDPHIYTHLLDDLGTDPRNVVFVDDRVKNLDPAAALGIETILYCAAGTPSGGTHTTIGRLTDLLDLTQDE